MCQSYMHLLHPTSLHHSPWTHRTSTPPKTQTSCVATPVAPPAVAVAVPAAAAADAAAAAPVTTAGTAAGSTAPVATARPATAGSSGGVAVLLVQGYHTGGESCRLVVRQLWWICTAAGYFCCCENVIMMAEQPRQHVLCVGWEGGGAGGVQRNASKARGPVADKPVAYLRFSLDLLLSLLLLCSFLCFLQKQITKCVYGTTAFMGMPGACLLSGVSSGAQLLHGGAEGAHDLRCGCFLSATMVEKV
jgi:hypothetical protein